MAQGDGSQITVEPGLIGGEVNRILAAHKNKHNHPVQYKIGPDPSSIDSCMVCLLPFSDNLGLHFGCTCLVSRCAGMACPSMQQ
jgi:D-lactate dehydrogenase